MILKKSPKKVVKKAVVKKVATPKKAGKVAKKATPKKVVKKTTKKYKKNVIIVYIQAKEGKINITECMSFLAKQDINNVFVEAGATLMESLFKKSLIANLSDHNFLCPSSKTINPPTEIFLS